MIPHRVPILAAAAGLALSGSSLPGTPGDVVINEVVSESSRTLLDEDGNASDWIELVNVTDHAVDLAGWTLADGGGSMGGWTFPPHRLPPGAHQIVWCSGKDRVTPPASAIEDATSSLELLEDLVSFGSEWAFLTGGPRAGPVPSGWSTLELDDSAWSRGRAPLGRGDEGIATGVPAEASLILARKEVSLEPGRKLRGLALQIRCDDGFVAYLNGVPVASFGLDPSGEIQVDSRATRAAESSTLRRFDLSSALPLLQVGRNILAVAVVNVSPSSEDLFLDAALGDVAPSFHTSFKIHAEGERLVLFGSAGGLEDAVDVPSLATDRPWGRFEDGTGAFHHLYFATPGRANEGPVSSTPLPHGLSVTPPEGFYPAALSVHVTANVALPVEIHFTLDGSRPRATSPLLVGDLKLEQDAVVRVAAMLGEREVFFGDAHTYVVRGVWPRLPLLSLALAPADLRSLEVGSPPEGRVGEREAYLEAFDLDGVRILETGVGLRAHGAGSRFNAAKRSFRVLFRSAYGEGRIRAPLIPGVAELDGLVLRGRTANAAGFPRTLLEDELLRSLHGSLGAPTARGGWCFLRVNGVPRGIYNVVERIDETTLELRTGESGWTLVKGGEVTAGDPGEWRALLELGTRAAGGEMEAVTELETVVDTVDLARFLIVNAWLGNQDLGPNWFAYRLSGERSSWRFLSWDGDLVAQLPAAESFQQLFRFGLSDILRGLLRSTAFQQTFLGELESALRGTLSTASVRRRIENLRDFLEPTMGIEIGISGGSLGDWKRNVEQLLRYVTDRETSFFRAVCSSEVFRVPAAFEVVPPRARPGARVAIRGVRLGPDLGVFIAGTEARVLQRTSSEEVQVALPALEPGMAFPPIRLVDPTGGELTLLGLLEIVEGGPGYVRGDSDRDGRLTITDAVNVALALVGGTPASGDCLAALDADASGEVTVADALALLAHLFLEGSAPPPPFPDCGPDPLDPAPLPCSWSCDEGTR